MLEEVSRMEKYLKFILSGIVLGLVIYLLSKKTTSLVSEQN